VKFELELDSDRVKLGDHVHGRVKVVEGGESRSLVLTLNFYEKSRDYVVLASSSSVVLHEGDVLTGHAYDFDFTFPADVPPSTKTKNGELYWEVDVKSDEPGLDSYLSRRLEVV
jgi:hypothetical protein